MRTRTGSEERMAKRKRPEEGEYYTADRTEHVAQGDIFRELPFQMSLPEPPPVEEPRGTGSRRVLETPFFMETFGILLSHTSGFMNQPPGTLGYSHPFRLIAPIYPVPLLQERGLFSDDSVRLLRQEDKLLHYMYLPPCIGAFEWEGAAVLYRPTLIHQDLLVGRRIAQMQEPAVKQLQAKIVEAYTGRYPDPEQFTPTLADHWNQSLVDQRRHA
jgi:hypothetical protein